MQFSIRNLYYVVWLQKNHMESLTSGVEPFILCAEFLNVDISKIAVMATLTVNLLSPCNVISSVALFHFRARPALGYWRPWLMQRGAGRERVELRSLSLSSRGGMGPRASLCWSLVFCYAELWLVPGGRKVLGMKMVISRCRHFFV